LEEAGGIFNIQTKEFYDAHTALLDALSKAGEPTSAPVGTRTDKRTATLTIDGLETKGKVKQLKTSVTTHTGVNKPANIVYLPSVSQEQLNLYLAELARGPQPPVPSSSSAVKIQEPVEYGADHSVSSRGILPLQLLQLEQPGENKKERWSKNTARANQLFAHDDATIRDVLLAERTTLGQLYGFIVGKTARAKDFHLSTLEALASDRASPNIIPGSRIIEMTYFSHDIPVRLFTAYVSALSHSEQLTSLFASEEGPNTAVKDLPSDLHTQLQVGRSRARSRLLDLFELLLALKLVTPLKPSTSAQPWITCSPHETHPTAFDVCVDRAWTSSTPHAAPSYWYFNTEAPIYLWGMSESDPPFWKTVPVANSENAREYWQLLKEASVNNYLPAPAGAPKPVEPLLFSVSTARSLRRSVSWKGEYVLTWHQARFLEKSIDIASGNTVLEEEDLDVREAKIKRICWVTSAPQSTVEHYLRTAQNRIMNDQDKIRSQAKETKRLKKMEDTKVALARKAEEAKLNREKEWGSLLEKVYPGDLGAAASRVERVRLRFVQAGSTKDLGKWEGEVLEAVREADLASKKILKVTGKRPVVGRAHPPANPSSEVPSISNISIRSLIEQQQPLLDQGVYKRKPKGKKKAEGIPPLQVFMSPSLMGVPQNPSLRRKRRASAAIDFNGTRTTTNSRETPLSLSVPDVGHCPG
jgi:transcription factor C subunit 3